MLTIDDAIRVWRGWKGDHARYALIDGDGARCAIGVLAGESLAYGAEQTTAIFEGREIEQVSSQEAALIAARYGISENGTIRIIEMNDGVDAFSPMSLGEIADYVERHREQFETVP